MVELEPYMEKKKGPLRKFLDEWEPVLPRKKIIEDERLKTMLRYYEPLPEAPPLVPHSPKRSNPNGRMEALDLVITALKDHEKELDRLIMKTGLSFETETKALETLVFRLEDAVSRLERLRRT